MMDDDDVKVGFVKKMEENVSNSHTVHCADAFVDTICKICSRHCDENDKSNVVSNSFYSEDVFRCCAKVLRSEKFWNNFEWGSLLNTANTTHTPIVCHCCCTCVQNLYEMTKEMDKLQKSINDLIRQFTKEVAQYRKENIQPTVKAEVNHLPDYQTHNESKGEMLTDENNMSNHQLLESENYDIAADIKDEYEEYWCEDYTNTNISEEMSFSSEDCKGRSLESNCKDNLYTFTNSSGNEDAVHLREFRIEVLKFESDERLQKPKALSVERRTTKKNKSLVGRAKVKNISSKTNSQSQVKVKPQNETPVYVYKCCVCETISENIAKMKDHVQIHENVGGGIANGLENVSPVKNSIFLKFRKCLICSKIFKTRKAFWYHYQSHTMQDGLMCNICGKKLLNKDTLTQHLRLHSSESFKCEYCDHVCKTKTSLKRHNIQVHTKETPFECQECPMKFKLKIELNRHIQRHEDRRTRPYPCTICEKKFTRATHLKHHMKIHSGDLINCEYDRLCPKRFYSRYTMSQHIKQDHTKEISFICEICGQAMKNKASLILHTRKHTGEKPFKCKICEKNFLRKQYLDDHSKTHTGETFLCNICSRTILNKSNFKKHMRLHQSKSAGDVDKEML